MIESIFIAFNWIITEGGINSGFSLSFTILVTIVFIILHFLSRSWPKLFQKWSSIDEIFIKHDYPAPKKNHKTFIKWFTVISALYSIILQTLFLPGRYTQTKQNMEFCNVDKNVSALMYMYTRERSHIFNYVKFRYWMIPFLEGIWYIMCLTWYLAISLVIAISIWLSMRLKQIETKIQRHLQQKANMSWERVYDHFKQIIGLIEEVNSEMGMLMLFNCAIFLIFICFFLFKLAR